MINQVVMGGFGLIENRMPLINGNSMREMRINKWIWVYPLYPTFRQSQLSEV